MESFSLKEQIVLFTVVMVTECVVFKNNLVTGVHSLLDERRSDSSTEEFSIFMNSLQFIEFLRKNSNGL